MTDALSPAAYDRPNTVHGLLAKHAELAKLRDRYKREIAKLTEGLATLEAAIKLFDPEGDAFAVAGHVPPTMAPRGSVKRFILTTFREANGPMTSRHMADLWFAECGSSDGKDELRKARRQVGAAIKTAARQGLVVEHGRTEATDVEPSLKLWAVKGEGGGG